MIQDQMSRVDQGRKIREDRPEMPEELPPELSFVPQSRPHHIEATEEAVYPSLGLLLHGTQRLPSSRGSEEGLGTAPLRRLAAFWHKTLIRRGGILADIRVELRFPPPRQKPRRRIRTEDSPQVEVGDLLPRHTEPPGIEVQAQVQAQGSG